MQTGTKAPDQRPANRRVFLVGITAHDQCGPLRGDAARHAVAFHAVREGIIVIAVIAIFVYIAIVGPEKQIDGAMK